jgi:hypothetical protein
LNQVVREIPIMSFPAGIAPRQSSRRQRETRVPFRIASVLTLIAVLGLTADESARYTGSRCQRTSRDIWTLLLWFGTPY